MLIFAMVILGIIYYAITYVILKKRREWMVKKPDKLPTPKKIQ